MAKTPSIPPPADPLASLSTAERGAVERLRMTPVQREAEADARNRAAMERLPAEVRRARETRAARLASMTADQRRVYHLGQHLVGVARMLREETRRGVKLADVLGAPDVTEAGALTWLFDEVKRSRATPVDPVPADGKGGRP